MLNNLSSEDVVVSTYRNGYGIETPGYSFLAGGILNGVNDSLSRALCDINIPPGAKAIASIPSNLRTEPFAHVHRWDVSLIGFPKAAFVENLLLAADHLAVQWKDTGFLDPQRIITMAVVPEDGYGLFDENHEEVMARGIPDKLNGMVLVPAYESQPGIEVMMTLLSNLAEKFGLDERFLEGYPAKATALRGPLGVPFFEVERGFIVSTWPKLRSLSIPRAMIDWTHQYIRDNKLDVRGCLKKT